MSDREETKNDARDDARAVEESVRESLRAVAPASERRTFARLAREIAALPSDRARAVVELSAQLAAVSLRACAEFLRAAPEAARVLDAEELRAWGEFGRRLASADTETGAQFFAAGAHALSDVPHEARALLFEICARQMSLSTSIAVETLRLAPEVARSVHDAALLAGVFRAASEIARRSARHSAEFLRQTPTVFAHLRKNFDADEERQIANDDQKNLAADDARDADDDQKNLSGDATEVARAAVALAEAFAARAGGIAADAWGALPAATEKLTADQSVSLFERTSEFLDRGGATGLHVLVAGGETLRLAPQVFDEWIELLRAVGEQGNAVVVALARATPATLRAIARRGGNSRERGAELARRVVVVARDIARVDAEAAISCLRSAPDALGSATVEQFERWARAGLALENSDARRRRSYYALETRRSNEALRGAGKGDDARRGLALEEVAQTLRFYVEGLTGRAVDVAPLSAFAEEARISDGRTIQLPANVSEFGEESQNFRLYKVLAAHAAGQIEFGTHARAGGDNSVTDETQGDTGRDLRAAYTALAETYDPARLDARDAFALGGYIDDLNNSEPALSPEEEVRRARVEREQREMPADADYRAALALFPLPNLAARIFATLENARIDRRLRRAYRGLARDLDLVRDYLRARRPPITSFPSAMLPFELLFQIALCGGALDDARMFYSQIVSEIESIVADYLSSPTSSVADTLMATSRVYSLFQSVAESESRQQQLDDKSEQTDSAGESNLEQGREGEPDEDTDGRAQEDNARRDPRELFSAWARSSSSDADGEQMTGAERWAQGESFEQELEEGDLAFEYDEWDRDLSDTRTGWCRVVERAGQRGDRNFVELTRSRYRGVISSIRHQFQLMKPESLARIKNELDGDDYDLDAVIDYVADRRAVFVLGGAPPRRRPAAPTTLRPTPPARARRGGGLPARSIFVNRAHHRSSPLAALHASRSPHHRDRERRLSSDE
jgi:nitric oxide reductase NorD protein